MIAIWGNKEHLTCVFPLWFSHDSPKSLKNVPKPSKSPHSYRLMPGFTYSPLTPDQPPFKGGRYLNERSPRGSQRAHRSEGFPHRLFHPWARWGGAWWPGKVPCRRRATGPGPRLGQTTDLFFMLFSHVYMLCLLFCLFIPPHLVWG